MNNLWNIYKIPILIASVAVTSSIITYKSIVYTKKQDDVLNISDEITETLVNEVQESESNIIDTIDLDYNLSKHIQSIYECINSQSHDNIENHLDIIIDKVLDILKEIFQPKVIAIEVLSGDQSKYYHSKELSNITIEKTKGLAKISLDSNKLIYIDDCKYIPRFMSFEPSDDNIDNILCCPIYLHDDLFGFLYFINSTINITNNIKKFDIIFENFIQSLEKSFVYYKNLLEQKKLNALLSIIRIQSADKSLNQLLEVAVENIAKVINAEIASIYLCDINRKEIFICSSCDGLEGLTISYGQGLAGYVAETGECVRIENAYTDHRFLPIVDKFTGKTSKSIICAPIAGFSSSHPIALIQAMNKVNGLHFNKYDEEILITIAKELSIALHLRAREIFELKTTVQSYNPNCEVVSQSVLEASLLQEYGSIAYRYKYRIIDDHIVYGVNRGSQLSETSSEVTTNRSSKPPSSRSTNQSNDYTYTNDTTSYDYTSNSHTNSNQSNETKDIISYNHMNTSINGKYTYNEAFELINNYNLDPFEISNDNLIELAMYMFESYNLIEKFLIDVNTLYRFLTVVSNNYHSINAFHNFKHGFGVMHVTFNILKYGNVDKYLLDIDILSLLIAAICHDIDHTGHNNNFEIASRSSLAILYSDDMVLERHHAAMTNKLLMTPDIDFLKNVSKEDKTYIRKQITNAIFGTDMSKHFEVVEQLTTHISLDPKFNIDDLVDRTKLCRYVLHSADIGAQTQDENLSTKWTNCCIQEFYNQTLLEQQLGLEVTPYMADLLNDEYKANSLQNGFINDIVLPLWQSLAQCFPLLDCFVKSLIKNRDRYLQHMNELYEENEEDDDLICSLTTDGVMSCENKVARSASIVLINEYSVNTVDFNSSQLALRVRSFSEDELLNNYTSARNSSGAGTPVPSKSLRGRAQSDDDSVNKLTAYKTILSGENSPILNESYNSIRARSGDDSNNSLNQNNNEHTSLNKQSLIDNDNYNI